MINLKIFEDLKKLSLTATHPKVWVASALVYRNKVVSFGVNQMKSHPFQKKYSKNDEAIFFHAENSAIFIAEKKLKFDRFDQASIYIYRSKYNSTNKDKFISGLACPCSGCLRCIKDYGIKKVVYSLNQVEGCNENFGVMIL